MAMKIDQATRPAGVAGQARVDGVVSQLVTLTDTTPGGQSYFELYFVPDADTTAVASLAADPSNNHVWTFTPNAEGPYRIYSKHTTPGGVVSEEIRIFGIPDGSGVVPPAPGERSSSSARMANATSAATIARNERNVPTTRWPLGQPWGWASAIGSDGGSSDQTPVLLTDANDGDTLAAGSFYICANTVPITLLLPDTDANSGKSLQVFLANAPVKFRPTSPQIISDLDTGGNILNASAPTRFSPAGYTFQAFALGGTHTWIQTRFTQPSRRSVDVDYAVFGTLTPAPTLSSGNFPTITGATFAPLLADDGVALSVGERFAVVNDPSFVGVFTLLQQGDGATVPYIAQQQSSAVIRYASSTDEVYVLHGHFGNGRRFRVGAQTREITSPLKFSEVTYTAPTYDVFPGKMLLVDTTANDVALNLQMTLGGGNTLQEGMRFGTKNMTGVGINNVIITPTAGVMIEEPATSLLLASITMPSSAFKEWWAWTYEPTLGAFLLADT